MVLERLRHIVGMPHDKASDAARPSSSPIHIDVSGLSHPGKVRERNEDHFLVTRIGRYLETVISSLPAGEVPDRTDEVGYAMIIADGMGGHAGGERASRMAISGLMKLAISMPDWIFRLDDTVTESSSERSKQRFRRLHELLIEIGRKDPDLQGMGTTLTAARNMGRQLQIVHVGDSRAYLFRDARLHRLTRDHTYVQLLVDSGQLTKEEAKCFCARNVLVNALGGSNAEVQVDVDRVELTSGDRVLLCSDGLSDCVDEEAIRQVLVDYRDSASACRRLIDLALASGGRDNVTVVIAGYTFSPRDADEAPIAKAE